MTPVGLSNVKFRWGSQQHLTLDIEALEIRAGERLFLHGISRESGFFLCDEVFVERLGKERPISSVH